jgi:anti-anti-sigma factor
MRLRGEAHGAERSSARVSADRPPSLFSAEVRLDGGRGVVSISGELDLVSVPVLLACVATLSADVDDVVLDLGELRFIDASGLHAIDASAQRLRTSGGSLVLRAPQPPVRRIFDLLGFERTVSIQP